MRLGFEHDGSALNWTLDRPIHNDSFGYDGSRDMSLARDDERSAAQFAVDLSIDFHQSLGGDAADNLEAFGNNRSSAL
jgi:hypothetical protein